MDKELMKALAKLEQTRNKVLASAENLSHEHLNKKPAANQWSLAQVLFHVYQVEKFSLAFIKKSYANASTLKPTSVKEQLRTNLLNIMLFLPIKFKAPKAVSENFPDDINMAQLKTDWVATHQEFREFLEAMDPKLYSYKIFKHPRIGYINIRQALSFFQSHFNHHLPQVKRLSEL